MNNLGKLSIVTYVPKGARVAFILPETQVCFFPLPWVAVGLGEGASLLAAMEYASAICRAASGLFRNFLSLAGQMKGQSQRWSIDVNKTNSR